MTDFVVSKVVMSVCALLVAGGLAEVVGTSTSPDTGLDLEAALMDLQRAASSLASVRGECSLAWEVPGLPTEAGLELSFLGGSACARAEGTARTTHIDPSPHTWEWDGMPINGTRLAELDFGSPTLLTRSGDTLALEVLLVTVDDSGQLLLFVRLIASCP